MSYLALALVTALAADAAPHDVKVKTSDSPGGGKSTVLTFSDADGWHRVTFSLGKGGSDGVSPSLEVKPEVHGTPDVPWTLLPTIKHSVKCSNRAASDLRLLEPSLTVTDLDGNGRAEVGFLFVAGCRSGHDSLGLHFHLLEGPTRATLRGKTFTRVGTDKDGAALTMGGDFSGEDTFAQAPPQFLTFATAQWAKFRVVPEAP